MDLIDKRFRDMDMEIATRNLKPEKKHVMMEEWGAPYFERTGAHMKDLDIMTGFIDKDAVRFNRTVANIEQSDDQITLTIADGRVASHAVVIGCGGIKGLTRRAVLADRYPESVEPQYTHKYVYQTIVSIEDTKQILGDVATDAKMYMSKASNLSTYPISEGKQVNVVAFTRDPNPWQHDGNTYDVGRKTMMEDFADIKVDDRLLRLLEASTTA
ncbi:hypothetical protein BU25DRAFT_455864 [Macroventuria anomochaeta]|uniref:Uncharacterized protein n=1 Tax=Macroventuria anomochaeta TaxID=301207 RepID=A0ACB6S9T0_9PLEO|nr:uncharacterized protein BU25DRAFT_455864 [Macroventuria anomochaeta]KAF2630798.1 hypothetical protein BU25DRAFT_455864 [Macroventuria anomochaeta]